MYTIAATERAGRPRRAVFASAVLLGAATALAGALTSGRHNLALAPRVSPPGWPASFQPPTGWNVVQQSADRWEYGDQRDSRELRDLREGRKSRQLVVRLMPKPSDWSAAQVASQVMGWHLATTGLLSEALLVGAGRLAAEEEPLGALPGARINLPDTGDYVHVGLVPSDLQPAVVLEYHTDGPFSPRDTRLCELVAESVKAE